MIIGIDIDDTLTYLQPVKLKTAQEYIEKNNLGFKLVDPNALFFSQMFDWTSEECNDFWFSEADKMLTNAPARKYASSVITNLHNKGHKIVIITARTTEWHKRPYEMSYEWLMKNNIPFDKLIVGHMDKTQVCLDEKIDVFIDDLPSTLEKLQPYGIKTILMETPHNVNNETYTGKRASNWQQVSDLIDEQSFTM